MKPISSDKASAAVLAIAVTASAILMLHHPTSLSGPDDGQLLADWSNAFVHGGMIASLFLSAVGTTRVPHRLGEDRLEASAGRLALRAGLAALVGAGLTNGFAATRLASRQIESGVLEIQLPILGVLNQTLAFAGVLFLAVGLACWVPRMIALGGLWRIAGLIGVANAVLALVWVVIGDGGLGLYPAVLATAMFGLWSLVVAAALWQGGQTQAHHAEAQT
jgi:hypothetical protein